MIVNFYSVCLYVRYLYKITKKDKFGISRKSDILFFKLSLEL